MSPTGNDRRAVVLLAVIMATGMAILIIPWFLTPPAYLDLAIRDVVFGTDLTRSLVTVTDQVTGKSMTLPIQKMGATFVARLGRINSGKGAYRAQIAGYKPGFAHVDVAALQTIRAPVDLQPTFGRLEIEPVNATRRDEPVPATMREGTRTMTSEPLRNVVIDLPPGKHRLSGNANGFCPSEREYDVQAGKITKAVLPLSPDLKEDEIARFVLGWKNEPRDIDSHFMKSGAMGAHDAAHLFWANKVASLSNGDVFARLDVDELYPGRYETVTVRANAVGDFRYFIHRYAGIGTIGDADAMVQIYTRGCHVQTFVPPPVCTQNVWNVADLHHSGIRLEVTDLRNCEAVPERPASKSAY